MQGGLFCPLSTQTLSVDEALARSKVPEQKPKKKINIRKKICENLEWMGLKIDLEKNNIKGEEVKISTEDSKVKVCVIPTNEELAICRETVALVK